jgi:DNA-nicking Smr family endonuclease
MRQGWQLIFSSEELDRIKKNDGENLTVDLHGLTKVEADRFIKNLFALHTEVGYTMTFIHGYNHGTALKDMIAKERFTCHNTIVTPDEKNQGVTRIQVVA